MHDRGTARAHRGRCRRSRPVGNGRLDLGRAWSDEAATRLCPRNARRDGGPFVGPYAPWSISHQRRPTTSPRARSAPRLRPAWTRGNNVDNQQAEWPGSRRPARRRHLGSSEHRVDHSAERLGEARPRLDNSNPNTNSQVIYYRFVDGSEGASFDWSLGNSPAGAQGRSPHSAGWDVHPNRRLGRPDNSHWVDPLGPHTDDAQTVTCSLLPIASLLPPTGHRLRA